MTAAEETAISGAVSATTETFDAKSVLNEPDISLRRYAAEHRGNEPKLNKTFTQWMFRPPKHPLVPAAHALQRQRERAAIPESREPQSSRAAALLQRHALPSIPPWAALAVPHPFPMPRASEKQ